MSIPTYLRDDLLRIWHTYHGLAPDALLRELIAAVTGESQPDRGPVTLMPRNRRVFIYGLDPCESGKLVFIDLESVDTWAVATAAAEVAGTWGRFLEIGGGMAQELADELAESSRYPTIEDYRDDCPNACAVDGSDADADDDEDDDEPRRPRGQWSEAELAEGFASLRCPGQRGPLDDDPLERSEFFTWESERRCSWFDPNTEMCASMPEGVADRFGVEEYGTFGDGPFASYQESDHDAILAAMSGLGYTLVRDQRLVEVFWGFETDIPEIERRLEAYRQIGQWLEDVTAGVGDAGDEGDEDDGE